MKVPHECKQDRTCCCYPLALEPNDDCPQHGYPIPRCACGRFIARRDEGYAECAQERDEAEARVTALEAKCERTTASLALAILALEHATEVDERHHYDQWWKKWAEPIVNGEDDASERAQALLTR